MQSSAPVVVTAPVPRPHPDSPFLPEHQIIAGIGADFVQRAKGISANATLSDEGKSAQIAAGPLALALAQLDQSDARLAGARVRNNRAKAALLAPATDAASMTRDAEMRNVFRTRLSPDQCEDVAYSAEQSKDEAVLNAIVNDPAKNVSPIIPVQLTARCAAALAVARDPAQAAQVDLVDKHLPVAQEASTVMRNWLTSYAQATSNERSRTDKENEWFASLRGTGMEDSANG
jgi:hypothetical protein